MRKTWMLVTSLAVLAGGCDLAGPIERQSEASRKAAEANELKDHIQQPIDRAKNANDPVIEADKARAQAIDDAGG